MQKPTNRKVADIYEKYAPKNISLQEFTEMVERDPGLLDSIVGEFSTFDPELAKIYKARHEPSGMSDYDFRNKLKDSMVPGAMGAVAQKYVDIYSKIICSDDDILLAAWIFNTLNRKQRQELAIKIVDGINNYFDIDKKADVRYIDKKSQQPFGHLLKDHFSKVGLKICNFVTGSKYKPIDWTGYHDRKKAAIVLCNSADFFRFMAVLSHEYGHFIDYNYPELGMLGAQIATYGRTVYSSIQGDEIYHANPTEVSSFKIGATVEERLRDVLVDQAIKKPELYIKALKTLISYTETQLAGLEVKYRKILAAKEAAYQEYQDLKDYYCMKQNPNYEQLSPEEITQIICNANENQEVKGLYDRYKQLRAKIPHEFVVLKMDLDHYKRLLEVYNDSPQRFKELFLVMSM